MHKMLSAFLTFLSAGWASGFILQDGGATQSQADLRDALRARQYVLLHKPEHDDAHQMSLLQTGLEAESHFEASGSAESIGQAATLNEAGFSSVAATRSSAAMELFTRRLLDSQGLRVKDQAFMLRVLPYYTGECGNQSFDAFLNELHRAKKSKSCHPAWITDKGADPRNADKDFMRPHTRKDRERAAVVLIKGVMGELGAKVKNGKVKDMWRFATRFLKQSGKLSDLKQRLRPSPRLRKWIEFEEPAQEKTFLGKGPVISWFSAIGSVAPLTELGYQSVLYARDEDEMASFIRRVAKKQGLKISNEGALSGMTPYYSGLCARQSIDALKQELHSLVGQTFAMKFALEFAADDAPSLRKLRKMIAKKAGVDVNQVKIAKTDIRKFAKQLAHADKVRQHKDKKRQRNQLAVAEHGAVQKEIQATVADQLAQQAVVDHKDVSQDIIERETSASKPVERQGFEVTISIDSAPKVHQITDSLNSGSFMKGHSRVTLPKTDEVESSKPTQCGGGLVVPK